MLGIERGIFARYGIRLDLQYTENSTTQRAALADGTVDIVHSAVDNAVAMVEIAGKDVVIVMGAGSIGHVAARIVELGGGTAP